MTLIEAIVHTVEGVRDAALQRRWRVAVAIAWWGSTVVMLIGVQHVARAIDDTWNFFRLRSGEKK